MGRNRWDQHIVQFHPGMLDDPDVAGLSQGAFRLLISSICYTAQQQTDRFIPHAALSRVMPRFRARYVNELVGSGWFQPEGLGGYLIGSGNRSYTMGRDLWLIRSVNQGRPGIPVELRLAVYERDGYACLQCGATEDLTIDHIHPFSQGGADTYENFQTLCRSCNSRKGARVDGLVQGR